MDPRIRTTMFKVLAIIFFPFSTAKINEIVPWHCKFWILLICYPAIHHMKYKIHNKNAYLFDCREICFHVSVSNDSFFLVLYIFLTMHQKHKEAYGWPNFLPKSKRQKQQNNDGKTSGKIFKFVILIHSWSDQQFLLLLLIFGQYCGKFLLIWLIKVTYLFGFSCGFRKSFNVLKSLDFITRSFA